MRPFPSAVVASFDILQLWLLVSHNTDAPFYSYTLVLLVVHYNTSSIHPWMEKKCIYNFRSTVVKQNSSSCCKFDWGLFLSIETYTKLLRTSWEWAGVVIRSLFVSWEGWCFSLHSLLPVTMKSMTHNIEKSFFAKGKGTGSGRGTVKMAPLFPSPFMTARVTSCDHSWWTVPLNFHCKQSYSLFRVLLVS